MTLKDILQKKDDIGDTAGHNRAEGGPPAAQDSIPEVRFVETDTNTEEAIRTPVHGGEAGKSRHLSPGHLTVSTSPSRLSIFRRSKSPSESPCPSPTSPKALFSSLLNFDRGGGSRNASSSSLNVPSDLPQIGDPNVDSEEREAEWEKRATRLVQENPHLSPTSPTSPSSLNDQGLMPGAPPPRSRSRSVSRVNDPEGDVRSISSSYLVQPEILSSLELLMEGIDQHPRSHSSARGRRSVETLSLLYFF